MNLATQLLYRLVATVTICLILAGCSSSVTTGGASEETPVGYFVKHQQATITTHGKILMGSVSENNALIQFQTEDGKKWQVSYSKRADRTYQYGTPTEVK
jgi:hypothetical protein